MGDDEYWFPDEREGQGRSNNVNEEAKQRPANKRIRDNILAQGAAVQNENAKADPVKATLGAARRKRMNVFSFGEARYNKLGHERTTTQKVPKPIAAILDKDVVEVKFGPKHALALTAEGQVYSWGYGGDGQLGHGDQAVQPVPRLITALSQEKILKIAVGEVHSVAVNSFGQVFTWGDSPAGQLGHGDRKIQVRPKMVKALGVHTIVDVAAASLHTLFCTNTGEVYACGSGLGGRLGLDDENSRDVPTKIPKLKDIQQVKCVDGMSIAMTAPPAQHPMLQEPGSEVAVSEASSLSKIRGLEIQLAKARHEIETLKEELNEQKAKAKEQEQEVENLTKFKKNAMAESLKLGMQNSELIDQGKAAIEERDLMRKELEGFLNLPDHFEELSTKGVKQIASGKTHVLALLDNKEVKCFGDNSKGQLGLGTKKRPGELRAIGKLRNKAIKMIACGDEHSVALTFSGDVYCWGSSSNGQCGVGKKSAVLEPTKVVFGSGQEKLSVRVIGAGSKHTVALTGDGRVYVWGRVEIGGLKGGSAADKYTPTLLKALSKEITPEMLKQLGPGQSDNRNTNEIKELIHKHGMNAKMVQEMLPNISEDPASKLLLEQEMNKHHEMEIKRLREQLEQERQQHQDAEKEFHNNQAEAMEKVDERMLQEKTKEIEDKKAQLKQYVVLVQQLEKTVGELHEDIKAANENIERVKREKALAVSQARTEEKAALQKALADIQHDLEVTRGAKETQHSSSLKELERSRKDVESLMQRIDQLEVEKLQFQRYGLKNQLKMTRGSVDQVMDLRMKLKQASVESINLQLDGKQSKAGLSTIVNESNNAIRKLKETAIAGVRKTEGIDPEIRSALTDLLVDNADLRLQVNEYMWALMKTSTAKDKKLRSTVGQGSVGNIAEAVSQGGGGLLSSFAFWRSPEAQATPSDPDRDRRDARGQNERS